MAPISGIIRPPPDIRAVADRTALFVSKNGRAFEHKILNSEKGKTPKFAFLHDASPFHAYYENRIRFYEEGGTDEEEKRKEEEEKKRRALEEEERAAKLKEEADAAAAAAKKKETKMKASAVDPVARALLACRSKISDARTARSAAAAAADATSKEAEDESAENQIKEPEATGPQPPPTLRFVSLAAPANLTPLEVEVIKLTAQYVALSDKGSGPAKRDNFLSNLTLREWTNPEFMFLQPRHAHFAYFTALVDGYRSFLPGGEEYERMQNKMKMDAKKERLAHLISDENGGADAKQVAKSENTVKDCLEAAAYRTEYERDAAIRRREAAERDGGGGILGGAGFIDWHDFVVVETIEFAVDEVVEALPPPTSLRLAALNNEQPEKDEAKIVEETKVEEEDDEMEESSSEEEDMGDDDDDDDGGEKLKVVSNYQPKVVSTKEITGDASRTHIIDPITGKSIAIADMPEHMRIQLLDPKWQEEKKRFLEKQRETNFVAGDDIASNINRFAQARGDIFGASQAELQNQKIDSERRLMEANELIRAQAMQQPQPQPVGIVGVGVPPPPLAAMVPPPPPPPPQMAQQSVSAEEPAAKRPKLDDDAQPTIPPSNVTVASTVSIPLTFGAVPVPVPPPFDPNVMAAPVPPPPPPVPQQQETLPEAEFIATLENPAEVAFCVRIPYDASNAGWNFNGQTIDLSPGATTTVKEVKAMLKEQLGGMPINKMQLKHPDSGFMNKDGLTLAHFNVGPGMTLDLVPKTRGGRK